MLSFTAQIEILTHNYSAELHIQCIITTKRPFSTISSSHYRCVSLLSDILPGYIVGSNMDASEFLVSILQQLESNTRFVGHMTYVLSASCVLQVKYC